MSLRGRIFIGSIWAATDRFGTIFLQFIVNLVLARLLMPSDYGCIGMLTIFIVVAQVLIDGGFGSALIQKKLKRDFTDDEWIYYVGRNVPRRHMKLFNTNE